MHLVNMLTLVTTIAAIVAAANGQSSPINYPGYIAFPSQNIGLSGTGGANPGMDNIGCIDPTSVWNHTSSQFYHDLLRSICDNNADCQYYNDESAKHWVADVNTISYISNRTCGNGTNGNVVPTSACAQSFATNG